MKFTHSRKSLLLVIACSISPLLWIGCGKESNDSTQPSNQQSKTIADCTRSPIVGNWSNPNYGQITFLSSCSGRIAACDAVFSFPETNSTAGQVEISIVSTTRAPGCSPIGTYTCNYALFSNKLTYQCGTGPTLEYVRI